MTNYSINYDTRNKISALLALLAIGSVIALKFTLTHFEYTWIESEISIFMSFGLYLIYQWLFDSRVWKMRGVKNIHGIPVLHGKWDCTISVRTSRQDASGNLVYDTIYTNAYIVQRFDKIKIDIEGDQISSDLTSAAIHFEGKNNPCLRYSYDTKKTRKTTGQDVRIEGLQELNMKSDSLVEGPFFSNDKAGGKIQLNNRQELPNNREH